MLRPPLLLLPLVLLALSAGERQHSDASRNVLLLGGNGFIGSHLAESLLAAGFNVTTLHRNSSSYWGWRSSLAPRVATVTCDRDADLRHCRDLDSVAGVQFLAVVDLSGFSEVAVSQSVQMLKRQYSLYVYISTDSVYDIVDKRHKGFSVEEDGVFPDDAETRNRLRAGQWYAEKKLTAEFLLDLQSQEQNGLSDYAIVRIPDTLGPRDNTYRFWYYATLLRQAAASGEAVPLPPATRDTPMSLAYVVDVAEFVTRLVAAYQRRAEPLQQIFNFAYPSAWTPEEFLLRLAAAMRLPAPRFVYTESANQLYPTVDSGPISVEKAARHFNDSLPLTPFDAALEASWKFYEAVERAGPAEFRQELLAFREKLLHWRLNPLPEFLNDLDPQP